ncbi:MAG TPA: TonB-dependent receptor plug domain-containing protein, partial [Pseudomonas sp.]|uniref:TonB-dependent receptor plug domain-containing protein n=1 Tax=Pseudomonas sp. TaxID=306 RepID=UPI002BEDE85A
MRHTTMGLCLLHVLSPVAWAEQPSGKDASSLQLEPMVISSERADGPVAGYRATRSSSATRTDVALHETPQSVSVIPRDAIEDSGATRLRDALDYAGGVGRANNFGGQGLTT